MGNATTPTSFELSRELVGELLSQLVGARKRRPVVTVSYAQALNGAITNHQGSPTEISCPESSRFTHFLRGANQAIGVGVGTLLSDNPRLTCRLENAPSPTPIIFDSHLRTPPNARVFEEHDEVILVTLHASIDRRRNDYDRNIVSFLPVDPGPTGSVNLSDALGTLRKDYRIESIMVEGGATLLGSLLDLELFDIAAVTLSPRLMSGYHVGSEHSPNAFDLPLDVAGWFRLGTDMLVLGRPPSRPDGRND